MADDERPDERSEEQPDARQRLLGVLMDKVAEDRFPSGTMMDLIEHLMQPEERDAYADVLVEKIASEKFPSLGLMRRLVVLTSAE